MSADILDAAAFPGLFASVTEQMAPLTEDDLPTVCTIKRELECNRRRLNEATPVPQYRTSKGAEL